MNNIQPFNVAVSDSNRAIFIDDSQLAHSQRGFTDKESVVKGITMDVFIEEIQIESVGLLKVNVKGAEGLFIDSFEKVSNVKHVLLTVTICYMFVPVTGVFIQKNPSFAF